MNVDPHVWRQPTVANETIAAAPAGVRAPLAQLPLDTDLTELLAKDDTLLATMTEQCRARGLYIVHNGREIKISPIIEPGWRVIHENDLDAARKAAA